MINVHSILFIAFEAILFRVLLTAERIAKIIKVIKEVCVSVYVKLHFKMNIYNLFTYKINHYSL